MRLDRLTNKRSEEHTSELQSRETISYAVLPYVYQGAVTHYGWLTAGQMMDGLALGESTPGPLIMVVTLSLIHISSGCSRASRRRHRALSR